MGGRLNVDGRTLNLVGETLYLDGGTRTPFPPHPPYNLSTDVCSLSGMW